MEVAPLIVDFEVYPHGVVRMGDAVIAFLPKGASIGRREATVLVAASVQAGSVLTISETAAALAAAR